jgi:hypothetical protein
VGGLLHSVAKWKWVHFTTILCVFISACATAYQPKSFSGGYTDHQIDDNTAYVTFRGNGFTDPDAVHDYLLRRCAEVTEQHGFNYFVIVDPNQTDVGDTNVFGARINDKFYEAATIKMYKGNKPAESLRAYNAADVLKNTTVE